MTRPFFVQYYLKTPKYISQSTNIALKNLYY